MRKIVRLGQTRAGNISFTGDASSMLPGKLVGSWHNIVIVGARTGGDCDHEIGEHWASLQRIEQGESAADRFIYFCAGFLPPAWYGQSGRSGGRFAEFRKPKSAAPKSTVAGCS